MAAGGRLHLRALADGGFAYVAFLTVAFLTVAFLTDAFAGTNHGWECSLSKKTRFVQRVIRQA